MQQSRAAHTKTPLQRWAPWLAGAAFSIALIVIDRVSGTTTGVWGRQQGHAWFNLGMAPLSGLTDREFSPMWNRVGAFVYRQRTPHRDALRR